MDCVLSPPFGDGTHKCHSLLKVILSIKGHRQPTAAVGT